MDHLFLFLSDNKGLLAAAVALLGIFIEIVPVKWNPVSSLLKWVGDTINRDTRKQLCLMADKLDGISKRIDKIEIDEMRSMILEFANSCIYERRHTKEEFEHIIDLHTQYERIIYDKGMKNGRVDLAFKYISELYTKCLNDNSFLDSCSGDVK